MKGEREPSFPLPVRSKSRRCGTLLGKVRATLEKRKNEEISFLSEEEPKMLLCPHLENTRSFGGQDERGGRAKVIILLLHLETMLHPPAVLLPMVGQLDISPDLL